MIVNAFEFAVALIVTFISLAMLLIIDWRTNIGLLAAQFLGVFFFIALEWPLSIAVTVLFAGWIAGAILGMAAGSSVKQSESKKTGTEYAASLISPLFTFLASMIIILMVLTYAPQVVRWIPNLDVRQGWSGLLLISMGLLRLILRSDPTSSPIALLTLFSGFEILFSGLTTSQLAAGLLGSFTLFIALAGSYVILAPSMDAQA